MKSEERTWSSDIANLVRRQSVADAHTDADMIEKLPQMIALGKYQEIVSICMKYSQQTDPVPSVGFVKQDRKTEANPVQGFCQFILGRLNETVADDKKSAADFYNKAIANGNIEATLYSVDVALKSIEDDVRKNAVKMLKHLALTGNPSACIRYAAFILDEYKSSGNKSRLNFAFELLRKVEDEPSIDSFKCYLYMAHCCKHGLGVKQNEQDAEDYYQKVILAAPIHEFYDNAGACAEAFLELKSLNREVVEAVLPLVPVDGRVAMQIIIHCPFMRDEKCRQIFLDVSKFLLETDGVDEQLKMLAYWRLFGYYSEVEKDDDKALVYLMRAANMKCPEAMMWLSEAYREGQYGLNKDMYQTYQLKKGITLLDNMKEDANYPGYLFDLGDFLYECVGKYEWADEKTMLESFKKAAELGDDEAKLRLVRMTLSGECKGVYTKKDAKQVVMDFLEKDSGELEDRAGLMLDLAHIYSDKSFGENYESAIEILDDALILSDNDSEILDYKGELLMNLGKEDEIADVWDELVSLYPDYVKASESLFCKTMKEKYSIIEKTY
ncbi:MAG: sel1 repeat family protein [Paludibacteraceae bacterium]|nr:sel1 repeat family protein [Paludibacteraceae bacterium]